MVKILLLGLGIIGAVSVGIFIGNKYLPQSLTNFSPSLTQTTTSDSTPQASESIGEVLTQTDLLKLADDKYNDGIVPLGDQRYITSGARKGYVYLCRAMKEENAGAFNAGPWISGSSWNSLEKISVQGQKTWPNATFKNSISGSYRVLSGNDLPINHATGIFPVASNDPAYQYDRNPNTISAQSISVQIPANPTYSETPYCMGGEVGIMLSGVSLFNAFDAGLRDAVANEVQDECEGHPQSSGLYHYHSMSSCFKDKSIKTVLGFAYDGFPITGPLVTDDKYLTTEDLDECHGITSEIILDGKAVTTYHYVLTLDFPYSVSCFRGKAVQSPKSGGGGSTQQMQQGGSSPGGGQGGSPPQEAINACSGKSQGNSCSFSTQNGTVTGTCQTPPGSSLACVPN